MKVVCSLKKKTQGFYRKWSIYIIFSEAKVLPLWVFGGKALRILTLLLL